MSTASRSSSRATLMVPESAAILKRFYFIERELILAQAAWLPAIAGWQTKLLLPELAWESSIAVRELRQRILELRYPERRIEVETDVGLVDVFRRCGNAPNWLAFVAGLAEVVKPRVLALYERYAAVADALDDGPTLFLLRHAIADLRTQIARLREVVAADGTYFTAEAPASRQWVAALDQVLGQPPTDDFLLPDPPAPDISPLAPLERPLVIARRAVRDPRFKRLRFAWPDRHTPGNAGEGVQLRARQAVHHANEVWAAEMAAAVLHDFTRTAPHEFLEDAARWCYDEIRHCRMGYERLKSWGFGDADIPLDTFSYDAGAETDRMTRLGIIFYFESTYIHTKKERTVTFGQLGDRLSAHDMDFDWADELIHTYYGKRWVEEFLKQAGQPKTLADVKEDARKAVLAQLEQATSADKAETAQAFESVMAKMPALA